MSIIYTIGHGSWQTWGKTPERFDAIVRSLGPEPYIVDVRSWPRSRMAWACARALRDRWGTSYQEYGAWLGIQTWTEGPLTDALSAIVELADRAAAGETLCLLCAETDPAKCHRHWFCGIYLETIEGCSVSHVIRTKGAPRLVDAWDLHMSMIDGTEPATRALDVPRPAE